MRRTGALTRRLRVSTRPADRGVTLVELLVYSALLVLVLTIVGSMLYRALVSQRDVRAVTEASNTAQLVASSVESGVRNAAAIKYTALAGADELLVARASFGSTVAPSWTCVGWFYDASEKVLYTRRVSPTGAPTPAITAPSTPANYATWVALADGVVPLTVGAHVFTPAPIAAPTMVSVDMKVLAGTRKPTAMSSSFVSRPQGETGSAPCF